VGTYQLLAQSLEDQTFIGASIMLKHSTKCAIGAAITAVIGIGGTIAILAIAYSLS